MEEFTQGLVAGLVLMFALMFFLGSVLEWRQKRSERRPWCERRSRNIYRELPGPDMTEEEANHFGRHLRFYSLPGQRNNAVVGYLTGSARCRDDGVQARLPLQLQRWPVRLATWQDDRRA